eukprot:4663388-Alexandrium_andersonii.AAC.1
MVQTGTDAAARSSFQLGRCGCVFQGLAQPQHTCNGTTFQVEILSTRDEHPRMQQLCWTFVSRTSL